MKRFLHSGIWILSGLIAVSGLVQGQALPMLTPMTFEESGVVQDVSPDFSQINIDGRILNLSGILKIHNRVNSDPVAPLKAGSEVGFVTNQLPGGSIEIIELWVLSSP